MQKKKSWLTKYMGNMIEAEHSRNEIAYELMEAYGYNYTTYPELREAMSECYDDGYSEGFDNFDLKTDETLLKILEQNPKLTRSIYRKQIIATNYDLEEISDLIHSAWLEGTYTIFNHGKNPSTEEIMMDIIIAIVMIPTSIVKCTWKIGKLLAGHFIGSKILAKKICDLDISNVKKSISKKYTFIEQETKQTAEAKTEKFQGTTKAAQQIYELLEKIQKIMKNSGCNLSNEVNKLKALYEEYRLYISKYGRYADETEFISRVAIIEFEVDMKIEEYSSKKQKLSNNDRCLSEFFNINQDTYEEELNALANQNIDDFNKPHLR